MTGKGSEREMAVDTVVAVILAAALIPSAICDLRYRKIPNLITFPAMAGGVMYHSVVSGRGGFFFSTGGLALGIGLMLLPYVINQVGAGDAKLMGAIGALIGPKGLVVAFVISTLAGGIYGAILLGLDRSYAWGFMKRLVTVLKTLLCTGHFAPIPAAEPEKAPKLRGAVAMAVGTFIYMLLRFYGCNFAV
jgi:prepilin peptidase CpaA